MFARAFVTCLVSLSIAAAFESPWSTLDGFFGVGRSIAGIITSGLKDLNTIEERSKFKEKEVLSDHDNISTDDLFSELSDMWTDKNHRKEYDKSPTENKNREMPTPINEKPSHMKSVHKLFTDLAHEEQKEIVNSDLNQTPLSKVHEEITNINTTQGPKENYWLKIKTIAENMKSIFLNTYGEDSKDRLEFIRMVDKLMEIGDKINMVSTASESFDKDLLVFLKDKWDKVKHDSIFSSPVLKSMLNDDSKIMLLTIAKGLVKQFGSSLHMQALAHVNEQEFVIDTMRVSGFTDSDIYDVFKLLDLPTEELIQTSTTLKEEGRSYLARDGGYGHGGGGYGQMMKKDPLVLLAGLAFATFAAYLLYRLLSSTPAIAKRSVPDISSSLSLSDMPTVMTNFYTWIENAQALYMNEEEDNFNEEKDYFDNINHLWRSYKINTSSKTCLRRYLCNHIEKNPHKISSAGLNFQQISLISLSKLLGYEGAGRALDTYMSKAVHGDPLHCAHENSSCDNLHFQKLIQHEKRNKRRR